jgi:hypothetical protein
MQKTRRPHSLSQRKHIGLRELYLKSPASSGRACYNREQFQAIFSTFEPRIDFDLQKFAADLCGAALMFSLEYHADLSQELTGAAKRYRAIGKQIGMALTTLAQLDEPYLDFLNFAAAELAIEGVSLPNHLPEIVDIPPLSSVDVPDGRKQGVVHVLQWPVDRQIETAMENMAWLLRVAKLAESWLSNGGGRGNRKIEGRDRFVECMIGLLMANARDITELKAYKLKGGAVRGNVVAFLEAVLRPLGCRTTPMGLLKMIERSKAWRSRPRRAKNTPHRSGNGAPIKGGHR